MKIQIPLTDEQTKLLQPLIDARRSQRNPVGSIVVCALHPDWRTGWTLECHLLPGERRDAIRAACAGELKLQRRKSAKCQNLQIGGQQNHTPAPVGE